jgi:hypothetical protein
MASAASQASSCPYVCYSCNAQRFSPGIKPSTRKPDELLQSKPRPFNSICTSAWRHGQHGHRGCQHPRNIDAVCRLLCMRCQRDEGSMCQCSPKVKSGRVGPRADHCLLCNLRLPDPAGRYFMQAVEADDRLLQHLQIAADVLQRLQAAAVLHQSQASPAAAVQHRFEPSCCSTAGLMENRLLASPATHN